MPEAKQAAPWVFYGSLALVLLIPFLFRTTAIFIVNLIGFIYPTFASSVAILKKDDKRIGQWLVYWVVYAALLVVQRVFDVVLSKIPFYPLFNALLLIALMHYPVGGHETMAQYMYFKYFAPYLGKAAIDANDALVETAGEIKKDPQGFAGQLMNGNENKQDRSAGEQPVNFMTGESNKSEATSNMAGLIMESERLRQLGDEIGNDIIHEMQEIQPLATPNEIEELIQTVDEMANTNQSSAENDDHGSASRLDTYVRKYGTEGVAEKLSSSEEVLPLLATTEDLNVDIEETEQ